MDTAQDPQAQPQTPPGQADVSQELAHINQEMYKRSVELAEKNKTLSLLRKIDEIILSSITNPIEIAQQVTNLIVDEDNFKIAGIYIWKEKVKELQLMSVAESKDLLDQRNKNNVVLTYTPIIPTTAKENPHIKALGALQPQSSPDLNDFLFSNTLTHEQIQMITQAIGMKSVAVYPLSVRNDTIGTMFLGLIEGQDMLSEFQHELIERLVQGIGIALDNALLYNEVQTTNEQLKALDKLKDEFVSLASHELRTPMTAIKSYLWLFLNDKTVSLTPQQKENLERAYSSTERLINLVNDMLNVSRIESGRFVITLKPTDMLSLVKDVLAEIKPAADKQGNTVELVAPIAPLPQVTADSDKIKEVLFNLIGNAIKFTPAGGKVQIYFTTDQGIVTVYVKDNGRGISGEDMKKLFGKFQRLGGAKAQAEVQGTGLGLYLSKSIVELHGGTITATSEGEGKGTTFSLTLRKADVTTPEVSKDHQPAQTAAVQAGDPEKPQPASVPLQPPAQPA